MKKLFFPLFSILLCAALLCGCSSRLLLGGKNEDANATQGTTAVPTTVPQPTAPPTPQEMLTQTTWVLEMDLAEYINSFNNSELMDKYLTVDTFPMALHITFSDGEVSMCWQEEKLEENCQKLYDIYTENMAAYMEESLIYALRATYMTPEMYYERHNTTLEAEVETVLEKLAPPVLKANFNSMLRATEPVTIEEDIFYVGSIGYEYAVSRHALTIWKMVLPEPQEPSEDEDTEGSEEEPEELEIPFTEDQFPATLKPLQ